MEDIVTKIESRTYLSIQHIESAALFTRLAYRIEQSYDGKYNKDLISEHRAYVIGAIFCSTSFLEASINEFFCDINDEQTVNNLFKNLNQRTIQIISHHWEKGIPRTAKYSIIDKYQIALELLNKNKFEKGNNPYQAVKSLSLLRNALIHYEPEWITHPISNPKIISHKFEESLKGKFKNNPLVSDVNPFYPDKVLSHGCAEWGVKSSIEFVDKFFKKTGLKPRFNHTCSSLYTQ